MAQAKEYQGYWRVSKNPRADLPLGGRSVGHGILPRGWVHGTGTLTWINIYWGVAGRGGPTVDGAETEVPPDHVYLHFPGARISGYPIPESWEYRWFTVDGPEAGAIVRRFGLDGAQPRYAGPCPADLFVRLEEAIRDVSIDGEYRAGVLAYQLLALAARGAPPRDPRGKADLADRCIAEMEARFPDPGLNVAVLARLLGVHRSQLSRIFRRRTGMPPVVYLGRLRLARALDMLRHTDRRIDEIAYAAGFADPAYFSRCVREETGFSPRALRERF